MIGKFFSGLSDIGKKLMYVAIAFVLAALFDLFLIRPTVSRMAAIDQEIVKEESSIKQDMHFLGYKDKILKESSAVEPFITEKVPTEEEITAAFLKKIELLAGKAEVVLAKITPLAPVQDKEYLKYQADLECAGKLSDVVTFMHLVDSSNELTKVVKFNLSSKKADSDELKATMTVAKLVVTKNPLPSPAQTSAAGAADADKKPADADKKPAAS